MLVDTAALTGEPLPRKVPRPERPEEPAGAGRQLLSGCIVKQGEAHCEVKETGLNTEIGQVGGEQLNITIAIALLIVVLLVLLVISVITLYS